MIKIRRVYDPEEPEGKYKILVDRLRPRGISKENEPWDEWIKELAPADSLRKWYNQNPRKWNKFRDLYLKELEGKKDEMQKLKELEKKYGVIILLFAARDTEYNNAVVLAEALEST
jgi:uncharacterized protein YeaO (DUF488 family)